MHGLIERACVVFEPVAVVSILTGTLIAFVVHEYAHAFAAYQLGDPTPKYEGRLTLNPLVHLHPIGSIMLVATMLMSQGSLVAGWAKPVRFEYSNLKSPFFDGGIIAFAGPLSNFIVAFLLGVLTQLVLPTNLIYPVALIVAANLGFGLFNCFPFPALDGWKMLQAVVPTSFAEKLRDLEQRTGLYGIFILLVGSYFLVDPVLKPTFRFLMQIAVGSWPLSP